VRGKAHVARHQRGPQLLEGGKMRYFATKGETDDGNPAGVDPGFVGQQS